MQTNPIAAALNAITIGAEVTFENLTMVPLVKADADKTDGGAGLQAGRCGFANRDASTPNYVLLDDALTSGVAEITEISEHGSVPDLRFAIRGTMPVLIIDGQELLGAKQNRVVNLTILAPPETTLTIPVSCVESGRWHARSRAFSAAPRTQYASGRAKRVAQVTQSIVDRGLHVADQAAVWADIACKSARLHASSSTGAMEALFDRHAAFMDRCVDALKPREGQVGVIFCVNKSPVALDLFDHPVTLQRLLPNLVRSIAVDAIDKSSDTLPDVTMFPRSYELLLAHLSDAAQHSAQALGLGEDVRLSSPSIAGAALVVDEAVVHLSAFVSA